MTARLTLLRIIASLVLLWGLGTAALHAHDIHEDTQNAPCDVCLIMTAGDEQSAAIALPASEFTLFIPSEDAPIFARFSQYNTVITPVRGPPKRGPPSLF